MKRLEIPNPSSNLTFYLSEVKSVCADLLKLGYQIAPYTPQPFDTAFSRLPEKQQTFVLNALHELKVDILNSLENVQNPKSSLQTAWVAMQRRGFVPCSSTMAGIEESDIIEIYNLEHKQLFRTFNFFPFVSHTLDELLSINWTELYSRETEITKILIGKLMRMLAGEMTSFSEGVPDHWVQELKSKPKKPERVHFVKVAALKDKQGQVAGYLHAFRIIT